jgi:hypothetical protein
MGLLDSVLGAALGGGQQGGAGGLGNILGAALGGGQQQVAWLAFWARYSARASKAAAGLTLH